MSDPRIYIREWCACASALISKSDMDAMEQRRIRIEERSNAFAIKEPTDD